MPLSYTVGAAVCYWKSCFKLPNLMHGCEGLPMMGVSLVRIPPLTHLLHGIPDGSLGLSWPSWAACSVSWMLLFQRNKLLGWGLANSGACECGEPEQTADHIINTCLLCRPPSEVSLFQVGPETRAWLHNTELNIWTPYTKEAPYHFFTWCKQRLLVFNVIVKQSGSVFITSFNSKRQILFSTLAASPCCVKYLVES